ncbi:hypothetical protein TNCV_2558691 [Trichonephila clavipes]|nr:hypothetical protein TNCV_2558691 [Trichonephila clavipes]
MQVVAVIFHCRRAVGQRNWCEDHGKGPLIKSSRDSGACSRWSRPGACRATLEGEGEIFENAMRVHALRVRGQVGVREGLSKREFVTSKA